MADRESQMLARLGAGVGDVEASRWDSLAGDDPFLSHAFLASLEESGSVGPGTGWSPAPILIDGENGLEAAAPAYLKAHSQGEYVFDHGWAEAWERAGGQYYPKLQVAVPFTPVPGARLLGSRPQQLLAAAEAVAVQNSLSSVHITFIDELGAAECAARDWLIRHGVQYHWRNRDFASFDDFLGTLTSRKRKVIRKEREAARAGLEFRALRGGEIGPAEWGAMWAFYQDTGNRKWGRPYLTREFFDLIGRRMGDRLILMLAYRDGAPIAGALNFVGRNTLFGRYWGCSAEVPFLHFELCFYQAIDYACAHGLAAVEAGAQGEHKIARGYEPVLTRSAHYLPNPGFRDAVAEFVEREREAVAQEIAWLRRGLPYRGSSSA